MATIAACVPALKCDWHCGGNERFTLRVAAGSGDAAQSADIDIIGFPIFVGAVKP